MADLAHNASGPASSEPAGIALQQASQPTSSDRGKLRVFISYSRDDLKFADQLDVALSAYGFECLIDRHGISGGEDCPQGQRHFSRWMPWQSSAVVVNAALARDVGALWEHRGKKPQLEGPSWSKKSTMIRELRGRWLGN